MKSLIALVLVAAVLVACDSNNTAHLEVRLTDSPGEYDAVNIDIRGIEINAEEGNVTSGWKTIEVEDGIYNLLELTNGNDTLLSSIELPAGKVAQLRLVLGDNNSVVVDGNEIPLTTPSASESGLKLNVHAELTEGITYKILLDFDAARSVVRTGNGGYNLKPVIRMITEPTTGAIKGVVEPIESLPAVFAIAAGDTLATSYADENGKFLLKGVPAGTYTVSFDSKEGFIDLDKTSVTVTTGTATDLGTIVLQ